MRAILQRETGLVAVMALMAMVLVGTLAAALTVTIASENLIAANYRESAAALYAADAALARVLPDLASLADWNDVLAGIARSGFTDGAAAGPRLLPAGRALDLFQVVNLADCAKPTPCSTSEMRAATTDRPWGANNPEWKLYGYGPLRNLWPDGIWSPFYVVVLVGDDPSETDNDPRRDAPAGSPGSGVLCLRAEAFGPHESHRVVELTVARPIAPAGESPGGTIGPLRVLSWRPVG